MSDRGAREAVMDPTVEPDRVHFLGARYHY